MDKYLKFQNMLNMQSAGDGQKMEFTFNIGFKYGVSPEELPRAEEYGALKTLVKPFTGDDLLVAVEGLLERKLGWEGPVV